MTCCPTYLWISPCKKPHRNLVKPIYTTSSLKWKIPFKKNLLLCIGHILSLPFLCQDLHRTKGLQWQKVHVCGSFLGRYLHKNSHVSWKFHGMENNPTRVRWQVRRVRRKNSGREVSSTCSVLDKAVPGSPQHLPSRREEDLSFESTEGKNSSATI